MGGPSPQGPHRLPPPRVGAAPADPTDRAPHGERRGRRRLGLFLAGGLVVVIALAALVSPFASSQPDGLEKVAVEHGLDRDADPHALADGPLADYEVEGVGNPRLGTALAGMAGALATFALASGVLLVVRRRRRALAAAGPG